MLRLLQLLPFVLTSIVIADDQPTFSGPQVGEKLPALPVNQTLSENSDGDTIDLASKDPTLVVFVHQITRPSVMFTRVLMNYAASRKKDGLRSGLVFLGDDRTSLEARLQRAKHAMPLAVPIGISPDGVEGPGTYGLNRDMTLTILVANEGIVTANLALVDPNIPVQLPKVLKAICGLVGGEPPSAESLMKPTRMDQRRKGPINDPKVESLLRQFIQKDNSDERVNELADQIDALIKDRKAIQYQLQGIAKRVHDKYGTKRAQVHLRRWAGVEETE